MPAQTQIQAAMDLEIDRSTHTIRLTRAFKAPREQIFEAWTQPEQVTAWWDPAGQPLTVCEIDLRPLSFPPRAIPRYPSRGPIARSRRPIG